ncbi:putative glycosyltransferase EpsD [bacterium BMS3Bbin14]|nr:putative glycosyltransferase EpsD [bacterium BMS3Bbin14]
MSAGHEVHVASRNLQRNPTYEEDQGLHIHRIRTWKNDRLNYAFSFPAFFSPFWKRFFDSIITGYHIDLIIVRDLPMAIAGIWSGRRHGCPVIFDMAEDYVAMVRDIWRARKFQGFNLVVRNPYLAGMVEHYALPRFDHVLVVIDEAKKVAMRAGASSDKITIVGNTPQLADDKSVPEPLSQFQDHYLAVYTGGIQLGRGLQVVFEAIPLIVTKIPHFMFIIIGAGYAVEQLKQMAREQAVDRFICWVGWVNHEVLFQYIGTADIGIIPHYRSAHVDTTIPNKIFDYMACGLPVIASDAPPLQRVVEETGAGLVFKSGDSADLAQVVMRVYSSPENYGEKGGAAVRKKYNWSIDKKRLLDVVNGF